MKNRTPKPVQRLIEKAGQDFTAYGCRVTNPHITARESIVIGDYIVELQAELAKVTAERDAVCLAVFDQRGKPVNAELLSKVRAIAKDIKLGNTNTDKGSN